MGALRPYILTILVHPQASPKEKEDIESLVKHWVEERGGSPKKAGHETNRRLAYAIRHTQHAAERTVIFDMPAGNLEELATKLRRQKKVLRFRIQQRPPRTHERTLKDAAPRAAAADAAGKTEKERPAARRTEKASLEKLDEKIEEILGEEVL